MSIPAPRFWRYESRGASHPIMSFGEASGAQLLIVPPLLEELNRARKFIADTMRALAAAGIATHLPDLPATGESEIDLTDIAWDDWRQAVIDAAAASHATAGLAIRGGCLIDDGIMGAPLIRFSPVAGKRLTRDLIRSRSLTDPAFDSAAQAAVFTDGPTIIGGYPVSADLACAIRDAEPQPIDGVRTVRLENEHGDSDAVIDGPPLWRRAEPTGSTELTDNLAVEVREWIG